MRIETMRKQARKLLVVDTAHMRPVRFLFLASCLISVAVDSASTHQTGAVPHAELVETTTGLCGTFVAADGAYNCEEYKVRTRSGFLLGVQKLWSKRYNRTHDVAPPRGPAFLYHGIMQGADIWVMNPGKQSLGFLMADAGYQVYMGNARSSNYSFGHELYTRDDKRFWNWGYDDMVSEDLPSMLDFIFEQTNAKIHYVGFSQGTMTAFAALAHNEHLAAMISKAVMLAPVSYIGNIQSKLAVAAAWLHVDDILQAAGVHEFSAYSPTVQRVARVACAGGTCYPDVVTALTGPNCCLNTSHYLFYCRYQLQSTSLRNVHHLAQLLRTGRFAKYDYGWWGNLQKYGSFSPPSYSLSSIPPELPILLAHGGKDDLADPADVQNLLRQLKGRPEVISLPRYAHGDFILGLNVGPDVYDGVLRFLAQ